MRLLRSKILLIGESENNCSFVLDVIKKPWNEVTFVSNIESALKESMKSSFDLIICFYKLKDSNAFEAYNVLNLEIVRNDVPFIIVFNTFNENKLIIAVELGVDSFIFPSFDSERIETIINLQLKKSKDRKQTERLKYDAISNVIPYGVFMSENGKIIEGNKKFYELIKESSKVNFDLLFCNIFSFDENNNHELKLFRLTNGLDKSCVFKDVKIKDRKNESYDISFSFVKKTGKWNRLVGIIIPKNNNISEMSTRTIPKKLNHNTESHNFDNITTREREILQLSAQGLPVKQIAEQLSISNRTVEKHRSNIINKTNAENIVEAVFIYSKYMFNSEVE